MLRRLFGFVLFFSSAVPASAQIDPLLFFKDTQPFVVLAIDTSNRMLRDAPSDPTTLATSRATSFYYDPIIYSKGNAWDVTLLGLDPNAITNASFRRKYYGLNYLNDNAATSSI